MFRFARGVIVIAATCAATSAAAQGARPAKRAKPPLIRAILVRGPLGLSPDAVASMSMLSPGLRATPGALETGRLLVVESISGTPEQGAWLRKNLTVRSEPAPGAPGMVDIVFEVPYNGPSRRFGGRGGFRGGRVALPVITGFNITGTGPIPTKELLAQIRTQAGQAADPQTLQADIQAIEKYFNSMGYIANVTEPGLRIRNGVLELAVTVGKVREMRFEGLKRVSEVTVRKHLTLKPGDYYNINAFKTDYTALFNTGLFDNIEPALRTPSPGNVDLVLRFVEKK